MKPWRITLQVGVAQTISWASSYYLVAVMSATIARDVGMEVTTFYLAFCMALGLSGLVAPFAGKAIDLFGGRGVLGLSNLLLAAGLAGLAMAHTSVHVWLAWFVLGLGMGMGLYDAAFGALAGFFGTNARRSITGVTLIAGFASTVGWPLWTFGAEALGWRDTALLWAAAQIVIALPLNAFLPASGTRRNRLEDAPTIQPIVVDRTMILLGLIFVALAMVTTGVSAHLPAILIKNGATAQMALAAGVLLGPAQVLARLVEMGVLQRFHPLVAASIAFLAHPVGAMILLFGGSGWIYMFVVLHGSTTGLSTIVKGSLPLYLFGPDGYGQRLGWLSAVGQLSKAASPFVFAVIMANHGNGVLIFSAGLLVTAAVLLLAIPRVSGDDR